MKYVGIYEQSKNLLIHNELITHAAYWRCPADTVEEESRCSQYRDGGKGWCVHCNNGLTDVCSVRQS